MLKIAARKSDLARLQAYTVADALLECHPELEVNFEFSSSFGDKNPHVKLSEMPEKGAFTQDFEEGLKQGRFDLVVHSWKDLPTQMPFHSRIFTLPRQDPRDVLLVKKNSLESIRAQKRIDVLTSSPRRAYHIKPFIKDFFPIALTEDQIFSHEVRGNIPTRLKKLVTSNEHSLIVAKAALDRLLSSSNSEFSQVQQEMRSYLDQCHFMVLPLSTFPTAAAQGALAIEVLESNAGVIQYLEKIHCQETYDHVKRERDLLASLGGGCHQKVGMTALSHDRGEFFSAQGLRPDHSTISILDFMNSQQSSPTQYLPHELYPLLEGHSSAKPELFFSRSYLSVDVPAHDSIFVSKDTALPLEWDENYKKKESVILSCSGLMTWRKLAQRGLWVSACSESLGEEYLPNVQYLSGREHRWLKLTHDGPHESEFMDSYPTYKLTAVAPHLRPDLSDKKAFYWMSGSQFMEAIRHNPDIMEGDHACGPGSSYKAIRSKLPSHKDLKIYLNYKQWYEDLSNSHGGNDEC